MPRKKKIKEILVAQMPKPENPNAIETIIGSLESLQASSGWAILVKILNDNIAYLEKAILEKVDPLSKESLSDSEIEILRIKRNLNIELRETPANYSKVVKDNGEAPDEYDPYYKTNKEIIDAKK